MKKILFILLLFITAHSFGQAYVGSDGALHPTGSFPVALSNEIKGAFKRVNSIAERDAIALSFRDTGMLCYVAGMDLLYYLKGGTANNNWALFKASVDDSTKVNSYEEVRTGTTNTLTVTKTPIPGTVRVYVNGVRAPYNSITVTENVILVNTELLSYSITADDMVQITYQSLQ